MKKSTMLLGLSMIAFSGNFICAMGEKETTRLLTSSSPSLQQQTGVRDLEKALGKNNQCVITQKDRGTLLGCCIVCTGVSCLTVGAMALCRHLVNCTGDPYWSPIQ